MNNGSLEEMKRQECEKKESWRRRAEAQKQSWDSVQDDLNPQKLIPNLLQNFRVKSLIKCSFPLKFGGKVEIISLFSDITDKTVFVRLKTGT